MSQVDSIRDATFNCDNTSNYALQFALKTMQERCQQLQKRLVTVEDENCSLRMKNCRDKSVLQQNSTRSELDVLRDTVTQLTKQKAQLTQNIMMVSQENRNLWIRLTKLTDANNSLGSQLSKINDTLNQHKLKETPISPTNTHLIRSKTFTQHSPREQRSEKKPETDYIKLEEISLKLIDQLSQEKAVLEEQCAQMTEINSDVEIDINSIGFTYPNVESSEDETSITELSKHTENLQHFKDILMLQQEKLKLTLERVRKLQSGSRCSNCSLSKSNESIPKKLFEEPKKSLPIIQTTPSTSRICPICGKNYGLQQFAEFTQHVEKHFEGEDDSITDNYEIITTLET